jgi:hypothetical protein
MCDTGYSNNGYLLPMAVTNQNAYNLLKELEKLHLIKVLKNTSSPKIRLSDKPAGNYQPPTAEKLQKHVK